MNIRPEESGSEDDEIRSGEGYVPKRRPLLFGPPLVIRELCLDEMAHSIDKKELNIRSDSLYCLPIEHFSDSNEPGWIFLNFSIDDDMLLAVLDSSIAELVKTGQLAEDTEVTAYFPFNQKLLKVPFNRFIPLTKTLQERHNILSRPPLKCHYKYQQLTM